MRSTTTRTNERRPGRRSVAGLCALVAIALLAGSTRAAAAAAGLIETFETAPAVVVAEVGAIERLEYGAYRASLAIERSLTGNDTGAAEPDDAPRSVEVAWEEPAINLPARLRRGRRIVVALVPLGTQSIWSIRVPDAAARNALLGIGAKGSAYLERPTAADLSALEHYLALTPAARAGDAGVTHLCRIAAAASPKFAHAALERLDALPALARSVTPTAALALSTALERQDGGEPSVGRRALDLVEAHRPPALRSVLTRRIAALEPDVPVVLFSAMGALDGGLPEERALALFDSPSVERRVSAARWARGSEARSRLRDLVLNDRAPEVRAAAVERLVALDAENALHHAVRALDDASPEVRLSAARSIARLDPVAVPELRHVVDTGSPDAAMAAIATLSLMGAEAHGVLAALATEHPDPALRTLAEIAVGRPIGHRD